jgi:hypothetical protein
MGINDLNDLERGEYDCVAGYPALERAIRGLL